MDAPTARTIVADVGGALAAAHDASSEPVLSGPFFPGLVWVTAVGALLLGLGVARVAHVHERNATGPAMTPRHFRMAPEEISGRKAGPALDVYFAGYFLFELLAGREPFPVHDETAYLTAVRDGAMSGELAPLKVHDLVHRCLTPDVTARPTASELARALRALGGPAPRTMPPPGTSRWWKFWS